MMRKGDSASDPLVWDHEGSKKVRKTDKRVNVDLACLPGPHGFLNGPWMQVHGSVITVADIAAWPYSVGILCNFTAFLGSLHWPVEVVDMGILGSQSCRPVSVSAFSRLIILWKLQHGFATSRSIPKKEEPFSL